VALVRAARRVELDKGGGRRAWTLRTGYCCASGAHGARAARPPGGRISCAAMGSYLRTPFRGRDADFKAGHQTGFAVVHHRGDQLAWRRRRRAATWLRRKSPGSGGWPTGVRIGGVRHRCVRSMLGAGNNRGARGIHILLPYTGHPPSEGRRADVGACGLRPKRAKSGGAGTRSISAEARAGPPGCARAEGVGAAGWRWRDQTQFSGRRVLPTTTRAILAAGRLAQSPLGAPCVGARNGSSGGPTKKRGSRQSQGTQGGTRGCSSMLGSGKIGGGTTACPWFGSDQCDSKCCDRRAAQDYAGPGCARRARLRRQLQRLLPQKWRDGS